MLTQIYKPGQGRYSRLGTGFSVAIVVLVGCYQLYKLLEASDLGQWVTTMVPAIIFVAISVVLYWLLNRPAVADFLIAAEGELKKVNWSSRKEVAVSTFVVIVVVLTMAALLGTTDLIFELISRRLLG